VGEVSWIDSLVFYICTSFFAYLITSPRRVSDARFPLFIVLLTSAAAERLLANFLLSENDGPETIVLISTLKVIYNLCAVLQVAFQSFYANICFFRSICTGGCGFYVEEHWQSV